MSHTSSLQAINSFIETLKARNEKPTQINVAVITGFAIGTVKKYWF
jgi:hypothetical protein